MSIDEVRALVAERQRYDDWLAALDARRAETPERVFQRVRADYAQRREEVLARLHTHVDALASLSDELGTRLRQLDGEVESLEDRRVEAMLRTAVGEYDGSTWDTLRDEVEAQLTRLTDERGSVQMERDEIRALLEQARPEQPAVEASETSTAASTQAVADTGAGEAITATPAQGMPVAEVVAFTPVEAAVIESTAVEVTGDWGVTTDQASDAGVETAAIEESIDIPVLDEAPAVAALPESPLTAADASAEIGSADTGARPVTPLSALVEPPRADWGAVAAAEVPLFFDPPAGDVDDALRLFAETPPKAAPAVPPAAPVGFTAPDLPPPPTTPPSVRAVAPAGASADPFDDLAFLRSVTEPEHGGVGTDPLRSAGAVPGVSAAAPAASAPAPSPDAPQKTLRCTECGTMNLPTEWYCERCGGELATF